MAFTYLNRGKKSISLDLTQEAERAHLRALVAHADILVEDRQPGALAHVGLGFEDLRLLNPGLIYVSLTPKCSRPYTNHWSPLASWRCGSPHQAAGHIVPWATCVVWISRGRLLVP